MKRLPGLSGFVRAKNEGKFIGSSIDSCIDALDELVVVYNDCTDDTEQVLKQKMLQYPQKIKLFPYNHNVRVTDLSKEEFDFLKSQPDTYPQLHAAQCNWALSKCTYEFAIKIDPDQIYFEDNLKSIRHTCKYATFNWNFSFILGWLIRIYISIYKRLSASIGKPCIGMLSLLQRFPWLIHSYEKYSLWQLKKKKAALSLSGINVFYDGEWSIPFDGINIHPPYNGEGDHLLFAVSEETCFTKSCFEGLSYKIIEAFEHPYKVLTWLSPIWFHFHANRPYCADKVRNAKMEHPDWFVDPKAFTEMNYKEVHNKMNHKSHTLYQRTLFGIIHTFGKKHIKPHLYILDKFMPPFMKNQFNKY